VQKAEHDGIAHCAVRDQQQGSIAPQGRAPCGERVDAQRGRAADEDLERVWTFARWGHVARTRKNDTIEDGLEFRRWWSLR
jgi:hypothetical protein